VRRGRHTDIFPGYAKSINFDRNLCEVLLDSLGVAENELCGADSFGCLNQIGGNLADTVFDLDSSGAQRCTSVLRRTPLRWPLGF